MALSVEAKKWLIETLKDGVRFDEPMARHTSLRVGGPVDAYAEPETLEQLSGLLEGASERKIPYWVIGGGTNLMVTDGGIRGIVVVLKRCLNRIREPIPEGNRVAVIAQAGVTLQRLCRFAVRRGLEGLNFALGIPGSVGGAITMNAGTSRGAVADVLERVDVLLPGGGIRTIDRRQLDFGYRDLGWKGADFPSKGGMPVIIEGRFRLRRGDPLKLKKEADAIRAERRKREPARYPSAGCFFKNPTTGQTAGQLIESAGLKGHRIGGAEISKKHANYIVNRKHAKATDILALMALAQDSVYRQVAVWLEPEVRIIGN